MKDFQRAMKLSLCFGLAGAVILPLIYEGYANISRTLSLLLLTAWAVFAGFKFSRLSRRAALLGAVADMCYSFGLGLVAYIGIHPLTVSLLEKNSKYFYLDFKDQALFWLFAFLIMLLMFVTMFFIWVICYAIRHIRDNNKRAGEYILNAFSEGEDKQ